MLTVNNMCKHSACEVVEQVHCQQHVSLAGGAHCQQHVSLAGVLTVNNMCH